MSYILEALKKADREREIGAVPDLATPHEAERPRSRVNPWLWVVVALLGVNAAVLVILLPDRATERAGPPAVTQRPLQRQADPSGAVAASPRQSGEAPSAPAPAAALPETPVLQDSQPGTSGGESVLLPEPAELPRPTPSPAVEAAEAARMNRVSSAPDPAGLPNLYELPQALRSRLELPRIDVHVYSDQPGRRYILVNLEKYREGETLPGGLVLEEILPDGMVLSSGGERFRVDQ
jgi:general secretion pathway protein B